MIAELVTEVRERAAKFFSGEESDPNEAKRSPLRRDADLEAAIAKQREVYAAYEENCRKVQAGEIFRGNADGKRLYAAMLRVDAEVEAIRKEVNERMNLAPFASVQERRRLNKAKMAAVVKIKKLKEQIEDEERVLASRLNEVESRQQSLKTCEAYQREQVLSEIERAKNAGLSCQIEITRLTVELEEKVAELAAIEIQHAAIVAEQRS